MRFILSFVFALSLTSQLSAASVHMRFRIPCNSLAKVGKEVETVEWISGSETRPKAYAEGISGGVFPVRIKYQGTEQDAIEKEIEFGPLNRARLALSFTEAASEKGFGPKFFGYRDKRNSNGQHVRFLYTERVGGAGVEQMNGEPILGNVTAFRSALRGRFPKLSEEEEKRIFAVIEARLEMLQSFHPDAENLSNFVLALTRDKSGFSIVVQGVDWDYPMNLLEAQVRFMGAEANPASHPLYLKIQEKLGALKNAPSNLNLPIRIYPESLGTESRSEENSQ